MQKAYEISAGPFFPPDSVDARTYPFPEPPTSTYKYQNRIITEEKSIYLNTKYTINI